MSLTRRPVGFLVWNPTRNLPTVQHETLERAEAEAERLRTENPDETFWVMSPIRASINAAKAFSDGKREGYEQALAEVHLAEGRADRFAEDLRNLNITMADAEVFRARAAEFQATVADCLLWFDGFNAAFARDERRAFVPDREKLCRLNEALQHMLPVSLADDEIPF